MTQINAGRVRFVSRGEYNNTTQYYTFDLVNYNGSSYFAKENTLGNLPTDTSKWQLIAEKGNKGNDGERGNTGETGNGIASITKISSVDTTDTYRITFTDGSTYDYEITNGEVTQAQLDEVIEENTYLNSIIDQIVPKVSDTGTSITLDNTIQARMNIDLKASQLSQETTSGKNKLNVYDYNTLSNTYMSIDSDGWIKANCTNSGSSTIYLNLFTNINSLIEANTNYSLVCEIKSVSTTGSGSFLMASSNNNYAIPGVSNIDFDSLTSNSIIIKSVTSKEDLTGLTGLVRNYIGVTANSSINIVYRLSLIKGEVTETTFSYEPFTFGSSPNPQFPQDIHITSGDNTLRICGKQLANFTTLSLSGDKAIVNGSVDITSVTASARATFNFDEITLPSGNYCFYFKTSKVGTGNTDQDLINNSNSIVLGRFHYLMSGTSYCDFTLDNSTILSGLRLWFPGSYGDIVSEISLIKGTHENITSYEPHQEQTAPLNLPVENKFNPTYMVEHQYNANGDERTGYTLNNNTITTSVNVNQSGRVMFNKILLNKGTYTLSYIALLSGTTTKIRYSIRDMVNLVDIVSATTITITNGKKNTLTFTLDEAKTISISLQPEKAEDGTLTLTDIQLEKGSKANSYTPYGTTPIEYGAIGDYEDIFFKNVTSSPLYNATLELDKWYLQKNIGKVVLDGSESWTLQGSSYNYFRYAASIGQNTTNAYPLSNYFVRATAWNEQIQSIWLDSNFIIKTAESLEKNQTLEDFKTMLATLQPIVYYILATPEYIPLNDTLQEQLDNIQEKLLSYKGQTNINQVNNDLPMVIKVSAFKQL